MITIEQIFQDKTIKAKAKVAQIGDWLLNGEILLDELLAFADTLKAPDKATCIESIEYATKKNPAIAQIDLLHYVSKCLKAEEPRIKWESAKVIGNIAKLFPDNLDSSVKNLIPNAKDSGTVVRWASAFALAEIVKLKTSLNKKLIPCIELLAEQEEDNGVKKKYLDALKKVKK